jgi:DUF1680 family protein
LQPFHYSEVTLTSGPLAAQAQAARDFFLALPNDDVLNGFRRRAGLPAPGKAMADGMTRRISPAAALLGSGFPRSRATPKYGDNLERVLLNGMLAALPMQPDGRTFYYSDYHPGAHKQYFPAAWLCCSGTYAEVTADYPLDIYFHDDRDLYVNLLTPSQVRWQHAGNLVTVAQTMDCLQTDTATFVTHLSQRARFALKVRVPQWTVKPATVRVNGRVFNATAAPGTFLSLSRRWQDGDTVAVTFPKSLRFESVDAQTPEVAALMYGPILLGRAGRRRSELAGRPGEAGGVD